MPSGKTASFVKKSGHLLGLLGLGFGLASCGLARKADTCNLTANGLKLTGYNGENLADKEISLVFLKGPGEAAEKIGSYLHEQHVEATFFVAGEEAHEHEKVLEKLVEEGHRIGTGGFSFTALKSSEDPVLEMKAVDAIISPFAHGNQFWLYGEADSVDKKTLAALRKGGLGKYIGPIHADTKGSHFEIDEKCWEENLSVSHCVESYFDEIVHMGHGIVPFHSEDERSYELIHDLIPELKAYGFHFKRLDEIPDLRLALTTAGGTPDATESAEACNDYE
jgi:peptidoglycan/xylan/chitin deacetylase (PgdA/CDA1 family)